MLGQNVFGIQLTPEHWLMMGCPMCPVRRLPLYHVTFCVPLYKGLHSRLFKSPVCSDSPATLKPIQPVHCMLVPIGLVWNHGGFVLLIPARHDAAAAGRDHPSPDHGEAQHRVDPTVYRTTPIIKLQAESCLLPLEMPRYG